MVAARGDRPMPTEKRNIKTERKAKSTGQPQGT